MGLTMTNFRPLFKEIENNSKESESYNSGLVGESMIVAAYKTMPLDKLIKLRFIINKIIDKKRKAQYCANASNKTE